jgi:hypothetical protein
MVASSSLSSQLEWLKQQPRIATLKPDQTDRTVAVVTAQTLTSMVTIKRTTTPTLQRPTLT